MGPFGSVTARAERCSLLQEPVPVQEAAQILKWVMSGQARAECSRVFLVTQTMCDKW